MTIDQLKIGDQASFSKTIAESDVYMFAGITGDMNPAHINKVEAENGLFHGQVAHGMLVASLISTVLGMQLPGPGTIYMGQELKFVYPVYLGDTITAKAVVESIDPVKKMIRMKTTCINQNGETVIEGYANARPPRS